MGGRSNAASKLRAAMQMSQTPTELLSRLREECGKSNGTRIVEPSVFGSAMQRCGQSRWWDALQDVRQIQLKTCKLNTTGKNIYITALARAARHERLPGYAPERQRRLVPLAIEAW